MDSAPEPLSWCLADEIFEGLTRLRVTFLGSGYRALEGSLLAQEAQELVSTLRRYGQEGPIAVVADHGREPLAFLVATILAGVDLISLPTAARGVDPEYHLAFLGRICAHEQTSLVVVPDESLASALSAVGHLSTTFGAIERGHPTVGPEDGFSLTQFTSGSTGNPRGVVLSADHIAANLQAMAATVLGPDFTALSWLPLSHDMGLVGGTLLPILAAGPRFYGSGHLAQATAESFIRQPASWLQACAELGATFTAGPDFAYRMAALATRRLTTAPNLARLAMAACGGEPVRAKTARMYDEMADSTGFGAAAFCPSYGLAEATLAVTVSRPDVPWSAVTADPRHLAHGEIVDCDAGVDIVSSGPPLEGFEVAIDAPAGAIGDVKVRGPSLLQRYADGAHALDGDGWFRTADAGFLRDGSLHVCSRTDDMFILAGRNVFAHDIEDAAASCNAVRGAPIAVRDAEGRPSILFEPRTEAVIDSKLQTVKREIRAEILARLGVAVTDVVACEPGSLPRTPSGKPRRRLAERSYADGTLARVVQ